LAFAFEDRLYGFAPRGLHRGCVAEARIGRCRQPSPQPIGDLRLIRREIDFAAGPYGTFKAALIHYLQGLAHQLADKGIRANAVSPGNTYFDGGVWANIEQNLPDLFSSAMALNPSGRMGTPEEIARTIVFVSSPAASRTSGANILVDGALSRGVQF